MAIAGVLVAAPQAHAAVKAPAKTTAVTEQVRTAAAPTPWSGSAQPATRTYTVRSGDTLSKISERYYGTSADWTWIYDANKVQDLQPQRHLRR